MGLAYFLEGVQILNATTPDLDSHIRDLAALVHEKIGRVGPPRTPNTDFNNPAHQAVASGSKHGPGYRSGQGGVEGTSAAGNVDDARGGARSQRILTVLAGLGVAVFALMLVLRATRDTAEPPAMEFSHTQPGSPPIHIKADLVRFFEGTSQAPELGARQYSSDFSAQQSRFIFTEVTLLHSPPTQSVTVPLRCVVATGGDTIVGDFELRSVLSAGATRSTGERGWGRREPGGWTEGRYRVECARGDTLVARGGFEVGK